MEVKVLKVLKSLSRLGSVVSGSVRKRRMSSAKAASLYVRFISTPLISGFALIGLSNGSRERIKIKGERGQPWRVPSNMEKASDRWPFTRTLAVGLE